MDKDSDGEYEDDEMNADECSEDKSDGKYEHDGMNEDEYSEDIEYECG